MPFQTVQKKRRARKDDAPASGVILKWELRKGKRTGRLRITIGDSAMRHAKLEPNARVCVRVDEETHKMQVIEDAFNTGDDYKLAKTSKNSAHHTSQVTVPMDGFPDVGEKVPEEGLKLFRSEVSAYPPDGARRSGNVIFPYAPRQPKSDNGNSNGYTSNTAI